VAPVKSRAMLGRPTLTMNKSRLASTIPTHTIASTPAGEAAERRSEGRILPRSTKGAAASGSAATVRKSFGRRSLAGLVSMAYLQVKVNEIVYVLLESAEFSATFWRLVTCTHSRRAAVR
jgi:hypothetical protein